MVEKIKSRSVNELFVLFGVIIFVMLGVKTYHYLKEEYQQKSVKEQVVAEKAKDKNLSEKSAIVIAKKNLENKKSLMPKDVLREEGENIGLFYLEKEGRLAFEIMITRVKNNQNLKDAFVLAKNNRVNIFVADGFEIGTGWINIKAGATDQEIIDFLLGK